MYIIIHVLLFFSENKLKPPLFISPNQFYIYFSFQSQWMTKEFMADLIYNNFIFTIPVLWDLCLTYGADNSRHMSKLMETVFTIQPKYQSDAIQALVFVQEV